MHRKALGALLAMVAGTILSGAPAPAEAATGHVVVVTEHDVYVADADGGNRRAVPNIPPAPLCEELRCRGPHPVVGPADVSPDGKTVAYVGNEFDGGGLFVQPLEGGERRLIDDRTSALTSPSWSYDGSRLAYEAAGGIVTVRPDGSERTVTPRADIGDVFLDWLPDGSLLYRHSIDCSDELWLQRTDGSGRRLLTAGAVDAAARSSADGRVVFARIPVAAAEDGCQEAPHDAELVMVDPASGEVATIRAAPTGPGVRLAVASDGQHVFRRVLDPPNPGYYAWLRSAVDGSGDEERVAWLDGAYFVSFAKGSDAPEPEPRPAASAPDTTDGGAGAGGYVDVTDNRYADAIRQVTELGITNGCGGDPVRYCPSSILTRGQLAAFLARALQLPPADADHFTDDTGHPHEDSIDRLGAGGIAEGTGGGRFSPDLTVSREQAASFMARAWSLPHRDRGRFADVDGTHAGAVEAIAEAGITNGCDRGGRRFCPRAGIRRDQMAALLVAALDRPSSVETEAPPLS